MTFEEIKNLQISHIISNENEFKALVKQCLSIIETVTVKDDEIIMWINAGVSDLVRQGIDVASHLDDGLIQGAIVMYVKGNFGFVEEKEKQLAQKRYIEICHNLSLSSGYKLGVDIDA